MFCSEIQKFIEMYEGIMLKTYFTNRFMQHKHYSGKVLICFVCLTGSHWYDDWCFDIDCDYKGIYSRRDERFSGLRMLSSELSMHRHISKKHKNILTFNKQKKAHNYDSCYINLSNIVNKKNWYDANVSFCRRNELKQKLINLSKNVDENADITEQQNRTNEKDEVLFFNDDDMMGWSVNDALSEMEYQKTQQFL
jgi:hypothetical protein